MNGFKHAGEQLRERREELGLTLEDAFRRTRIASAHLAALEKGDLSALPEPCFAAGFVRSYCELLGLAPERYVDCLRAATRSGTRRRGQPRSRSIDLSALLNPRFALPSWTGQAAAWIVICTIVALSWMAYSVAFKPSADPRAGRAQASTLDMVVPPAEDDSSR